MPQRRPAHRRRLRQYFDSALYANNLDNAAMDYLLTNSTFKEVPTQITSYYIRMFLNYHSQLATQYGMELDATHRPRLRRCRRDAGGFRRLL